MWVAAAFSTAFAVIAAYCAFLAHRSEARLHGMRSELAAVGEDLMALGKAHRKLAGRVYADEYWNGQREEQPQLAPVGPPPGEVCERYLTAQREGPLSAAARCGCAYCEFQRAERDRFRAKAVPKSARGVAELAKLNGSSDG